MTQHLQEAFERCVKRFPAVQLSFESYQERVCRTLSEMPGGEEGRSQSIAGLHFEDLFLATACAQGDRVAWEYFADDCLPLLRKYAAQACRNPGEADDLAQEITAKLLNDKCRLGAYNGRGSLAGWLRVAAAHAAIDRFRRARNQTSLEALQEGGNQTVLAYTSAPAEEDALDSKWGRVILEIVDGYVGCLAARDRLMLCLYYLKGLSLKDLGHQFGIHEATASRWLEKTRQEIKKRVEKELRKKHKLRSGEIKSLWKWVPPWALAESISGSLSRDATRVREDGGIKNNSATGSNPDVIKKEELR